MAAKQHSTPTTPAVSPELDIRALTALVNGNPVGFAAALEAQIKRDPDQMLGEAAGRAMEAMAAARTPAKPAAEMVSVRQMSELESFIYPMLNASCLLSHLDVEHVSGCTDGAEAIRWLADFVHERAHELEGVLQGRRPKFQTDSEAQDRARVLGRLPQHA